MTAADVGTHPCSPMVIEAMLGNIDGKSIDMMAHCVGLDRVQFPRRCGKSAYTAYRNHYHAGKGDAPKWDSLVALGYAESNASEPSVYHLTEDGIGMLSACVGLRVICPDQEVG